MTDQDDEILIGERTIDVPLQLPWNLICEIACFAMIHRIDFNAAVVSLMMNYQNRVRFEDEIRSVRRGKKAVS